MKSNRSLIQIVLFSVIFYSAIAFIQYLFVENETQKTSLAQADIWADMVLKGLNFIDHWDTEKYRQSDINIPRWYIITEEGLIFDIEGFIPGIIPSPKFSINSAFEQPKSITTEIGDTWRLIRKPIKGGSVILGIYNPMDLNRADKTLTRNAELFDSMTLNDAVRFPIREIENIVDYAVIDSQGTMKQQYGGISTKLEHNDLLKLKEIPIEQKYVNGNRYVIKVKPIISNVNKIVGRVIIPCDITLQQEALRIQEQFNLVVIGISWLITIILICFIYIMKEKKRREQEISLEEALNKGEGQSIEFKAGVPDDILTRTIAAFANTEGGNIFLGVNDNGMVIGLTEKSTKEKDILLQKIRSSIDQAITPRLSLYPTFLEYEGKTVLRIFVPTGVRPIYLVGGIAYIRQMNSVVRARAEDLESRFRKWNT